MAEAPRNDLDLQCPDGLLADLTTPPIRVIRPDEVARARRHAADGTYDHGAVVEEAAAQILLLSRA